MRKKKRGRGIAVDKAIGLARLSIWPQSTNAVIVSRGEEGHDSCVAI